MYCNYLNGECYGGTCSICTYYLNYWNKINYPQQFNYECPDCHGKFNYPGTIINPSTSGGTYFINVCPFCNKEMKGLK